MFRPGTRHRGTREAGRHQATAPGVIDGAGLVIGILVEFERAAGADVAQPLDLGAGQITNSNPTEQGGTLPDITNDNKFV